MRMGFIGAGVVGTALGKLFGERGFDIVGYYSRSVSSAARAAEITNSRYFKSKAALLENIDTLFVTTNDDAITPVVEQLSEEGLINGRHTVIHCSGSLTLSVLAPAREDGARVLSLHPLQSCASAEFAVEKLPGAVFSIEGGNDARVIGVKLVEALGAIYFFIDCDKKALYHAAAVVASNYLVTLIDLSKRLMVEAGMPEDQFVPAIYPLIEGTLANIEKLGIPDALTGPIARGDVETIKDHLARIAKEVKDADSLYRTLGKETIGLALEKGSLSNEKGAVIKKLLENGGV
ncbi:DUF2520 domain-containing protein [Metallumcola ferriviriculae]|uniref:DUF2520 domain-containing protein n=1 Tax=Metallumcola ferriviriculae TaxID=3039180 RepID=A0AAU0UJ71_9FIRM|nr:DUF2520 domain-containing protein [Desulfitibacteraceae bacterium MK1]